MRAQVVARVGPLDDADVGEVGRDLVLQLGRAVEDEDKVGAVVQGVLEEEAGVGVGVGRVVVDCMRARVGAGPDWGSAGAARLSLVESRTDGTHQRG